MKYGLKPNHDLSSQTYSMKTAAERGFHFLPLEAKQDHNYGMAIKTSCQIIAKLLKLV